MKFTLKKGALLGYYLGQATIKNLGIIYTDATYDSANAGKTGYGVFGAKSNGVSVIENCYIERVSNPYRGTSVFGIMASPNNKLILRNTVVNGTSTTNNGNMHSNMKISAESTNAYVIYARHDKGVTGWDMALNFTEVVESNIIKDGSAFDTNVWTIVTHSAGHRITWAGMTDAAYAAVLKVNVQ